MTFSFIYPSYGMRNVFVEALRGSCRGCPPVVLAVRSASRSHYVLAPFPGHCPPQKVTPVAFLWPDSFMVQSSVL